MSLEPKHMKIGKHQYTVRYMPPGEGLAVLGRLLNLIGPGLKSLTEEGEGEKLAGFLGEILSNEKLAPTIEYFGDVFKKHTTVTGDDGEEIELAKIYGVFFMGNYFELVRWISFCFEVNHSSFLAELGVSAEGIANLIVSRLQSRSPNPRAKRGSSGESFSPEDSVVATGK